MRTNCILKVSRHIVNIIVLRACSYGQKLSRFPRKISDRSNNVALFIWRKVSRDDIDFVKCKQKVFPLSGKVVFIWDKNYLGRRDLACHQARSRLTGKLFVSYERKVTFHTIFVRRRDLACKLGPKTALLRVTNDVVMNMNCQHVSLLVSSAFEFYSGLLRILVKVPNLFQSMVADLDFLIYHVESLEVLVWGPYYL